MKDKIITVLVILAIVFFALWYPWFTEVNNGETTCHNVFGVTMKCR